jgi:transcriptional regulator with PAS, ATPase and Fis domain
MAVKADTEALLDHLVEAMAGVARGRYGKPEEVFELTKRGAYPDKVVELAESFGMMIVKVEAREFQLQQTIEKLRRANKDLEHARRRLTKENSHLKRHLRKKFSPGRIIGRSHAIQSILDRIDKVAEAPANVLITGETGTGKELFAKAIHYHSGRQDKPFVALNCSALPENLIESELFGIEKGVATGVDQRIGRIEQAHGGTLFLDEIGDMPPLTQAKILRVLEESTVERVGGRKSIPVDVKVVAATNRDLKEAIAKREFREDLYYRLNVVHLSIPPLRERREDIPLLAAAFLERYGQIMNRTGLKLSEEGLKHLVRYDWPGNVRELENEVERAVVLACDDRIGREDLSPAVLENSRLEEAPPDLDTLPENLKEVEKLMIQRTLEKVGGNKTEAARRLGMSREGLRKKLNRL